LRGSIAAQPKPAARGELEITDVNQIYLESGQIDHAQLTAVARNLDYGRYLQSDRAGNR